MRTIRRLTALVVLGILCAAALYAQSYRYVDDDGNVVYSDRVPPQKSQREQRVYSRDGRVIDIIKAPKSKAELAREHRQAQLEAAERRKARDQAQRDRALLHTFTSLKELEIARDDRVETLDASIAISRQKLTRLRSDRTKLQSRIQGFEQRDRRPPAWMMRKAHELARQMANTRAIIDTKHSERQVIQDRFAKDIERYKTLKQIRADKR